MQLGVEFVDLTVVSVPVELASYVPKNIAKKFCVVPVKLVKDTLYLAMSDPLDFVAQEEVKVTSRKRVIPMIATRRTTEHAISLLYGSEGTAGVIEEMKREAGSSTPDIVPVQVSQEAMNSGDSAPTICVELTKMDEGCTLKKSEHCYAVWKKKRRCENCISQEVLRTHKPQTKIETRASDIYYVLASFIEVDGRPYSLELVKRIKSDDMFERENVLNQLLVRDWQVYMDSVTKVYNRRYYDERLKNLEGWFSFAMIDMDNFKHINDRFGHQAGDAALYRAAQAIKSQIRSDDELVRYGGDEFFLLFRDLPQQILEKKLQSIRAALDEIVIEEYPEPYISASIGGDYGEAKARFQNDERIVRFLNMFPGDDSMQNLTNAMNTGDTTTAFRAVHTLKGVALNLGLGSLAHASSQMTEALRAVRIRCLKAYSHSMWRCGRSTLPCAARLSSSKSN